MATEAGTFAASPYDEGLDVNNLPDAPWTPEALGDELFDKLARVCGAGNIKANLGASLDPRTFARGRASVIARNEGLTNERLAEMSAADDEESFQKAMQRRQELFAEAELLQAAINAKLPGPSGTARNPNAPPLTGSTTTQRKRTF